MEAFYDPQHLISRDSAHSVEENRYNKIRIIGAAYWRKGKKYMPRKIVYEDNPWPDVKDFDIEDFKIVKNLLPLPEVLRKAEIDVIGNPGVYVHLSKKDMQALRRRASKQGVPSHALATAVLHSFITADNGKRT